MRSIIAVTHHNPHFLKAAYAADLDLTDHERHIKAGAKYITWQEHDTPWRVWRMTRERVPIPLGRFKELGGALYVARK